jgi:hypothetical protein
LTHQQTQGKHLNQHFASVCRLAEFDGIKIYSYTFLTLLQLPQKLVTICVLAMTKNLNKINKDSLLVILLIYLQTRIAINSKNQVSLLCKQNFT